MPLSLPLHSVQSAPAHARETLKHVEAGMGFIPNIYAGMANSPPLLGAYESLSAAFQSTSLSLLERQAVLIAASVENRCAYCVAAHSWVARRMTGIPAETLAALRAGADPADARLGALAAFTRAVVRQRGWVNRDPALTRFLAAGYRPEQALEVILGVTQKILSNYVEHLLATPLDAALADEAWEEATTMHPPARTGAA